MIYEDIEIVMEHVYHIIPSPLIILDRNGTEAGGSFFHVKDDMFYVFFVQLVVAGLVVIWYIGI